MDVKDLKDNMGEGKHLDLEDMEGREEVSTPIHSRDNLVEGVIALLSVPLMCQRVVDAGNSWPMKTIKRKPMRMRSGCAAILHVSRLSLHQLLLLIILMLPLLLLLLHDAVVIVVSLGY